jgi:hypothetical protein
VGITHNREFKFNTAITGVDESDGTFDEAAHKRAVLPLRGKIMQLDGVTGCHINRYEVTVHYVPGITTPELIEEAIRAAIEELLAEDDCELFPLRGTKKPTATFNPPQTTPTHRVEVNARFGSYVTKFPVGEKNGYDKAAFDGSTKRLVEQLVDFDGVIGCELYLQTVTITFDDRIANEADVKQLVTDVISEAAEGEEFFPYLGAEILSIDFE